MIINKIIYIFSESVKSILRSFIPSLISSLTVAVSLIVLSGTYFFYINLQDFSNEVKDEYKIEVFFNNDLNLTKALDVFNKILLIDGIEDGTFIDKEVAASIFKKEFNEDVNEIIGDNPLPMSGVYGISNDYRTNMKMEDITKKINGMPEVDIAMYAQEATIKFDQISRNVLSFSFLLGFFIMLISLFFVSNTILLVMYSKKNEIATLKLLGATRLFIKTPYLIEGLILGIFGSIFSISSLFAMYQLSIYIIEPYIIIPSIKYIHIIVINLVVGALLGVIGSSRALSSNTLK